MWCHVSQHIAAALAKMVRPSVAASLLSPALLSCRLTRCVLGALGQAEEERFVHAVMLAEFDIDKGSICRTQYPKEVCEVPRSLSALSPLL